VVDPTKALEAQLAAISLCQQLVASEHPQVRRLRTNFEHDVDCLTGADPFVWATDPIDACTQASGSIPADTLISPWNLGAAAWWFFETPLPIITNQTKAPIQALNLSWVRETSHEKRSGFRVAVWCPSEANSPTLDTEQYAGRLYPYIPSQVWWWMAGETMAEMLSRCEQEHQSQYSRQGRFGNAETVGIDVFMDATTRISRFVLAAMAWLEQKVVVQTEAPVHRQRRKEFTRLAKREYPGLRIVHLRKAAQPNSDDTVAERMAKREFHVQWVVGGHWRNQACGPKMGDRRLTYINPYIKGPDDKPLKPQAQKVFAVDR
jgi:hypothetical protein